VLLRLEAADDREGDSNLGSAGAGSGIVHAGAVAGFAMPMLRYVVLGDGSASRSDGASRLSLLAPRDGASMTDDSPVRLAWSPDRMATYYRVDVESSAGRDIVRALVPGTVLHYELPSLLAGQSSDALRWRVTALDGAGSIVRRTAWRRLARGAQQE
jgi:hypothetical protein